VQDCSSFSSVSPIASAEGPLPDPFSLQIQVSHHPLQYSIGDATLRPYSYTAHLGHQDNAGLNICSWMSHPDFEQSLKGTKIWHRHPLRFVSLIQGGSPLMAHLIVD
jgi:hypothetical protein